MSIECCFMVNNYTTLSRSVCNDVKLSLHRVTSQKRNTRRRSCSLPRQWMNQWLHRFLVNLWSQHVLELMYAIDIPRTHTEPQRFYSMNWSKVAWTDASPVRQLFTHSHAWLDIMTCRCIHRCPCRHCTCMSPPSTTLQHEALGSDSTTGALVGSTRSLNSLPVGMQRYLATLNNYFTNQWCPLYDTL